MPSFSHLIFVIAIWSSLANATPTVEQGNSPQPKQDNCGLGYGKVNAKDCTSALQVQVPGQIDDTLRQYVPRLSWNDRTSTGLTLPVENTPKSWHYGQSRVLRYASKPQVHDCLASQQPLNTKIVCFRFLFSRSGQPRYPSRAFARC